MMMTTTTTTIKRGGAWGGKMYIKGNMHVDHLR